ncbi:DNA topoisomerase [Oleoguttula sp. CCFEE 5521]
MVTKVLCVAEKPSIARAVAGHLAGENVQGRNIQGNNFTKNFEFDFNFPTWGPCSVVMTSVAGHLTSQDFAPEYKKWQSCDPAALFEAPIVNFVDEDRKPIAANIERQARYCQILYIWTDCDREGEHIGTEIRKTASDINPRLRQPGKTVRARFSNIERAHILNAARHPIPLDEAQADAVSARMELDLRIGSSYTRSLTLNVGNIIKQRMHSDDKQILSYGSCQFPTLGFVVERYFRVRNFVPETFWGIKVMHKKDDIDVSFRWARGHLFDRMVVVILFERCLTAKTARVTKMQTKPTSKWKPLPLTTVELQKCGSRFLRMDSQRVMQLAEQLYQKGWISYPRTETDQFDRAIDLRALITKQTQGQTPWTAFANGLLNGEFSNPRQGRNNDKAHPPIHPVNFVSPENLTVEEQRVHEFIVRRFLACCAKDAQGSKTEVSILYGPETFNTSGLIVLERNYLDVYPYDKWTSSQDLPNYREGDVFEPTEARIEDGKTSPPTYLTEPELIGLMDANGIGTDATMAEHIAKIKERQYVQTQARGAAPRQVDQDAESDFEDVADRTAPQARGRGRGRGRAGRGGAQRAVPQNQGMQEFIPTTLGVALVEGYDNMGLETSLSKPFLRKEMELKMKAICEGRMTRREVVQESLDQYRDVYIRAQRQLPVLHAAVRKYVFGEAG